MQVRVAWCHQTNTFATRYPINHCQEISRIKNQFTSDFSTVKESSQPPQSITQTLIPPVYRAACFEAVLTVEAQFPSIRKASTLSGSWARQSDGIRAVGPWRSPRSLLGCTRGYAKYPPHLRLEMPSLSPTMSMVCSRPNHCVDLHPGPWTLDPA